jgi:hypothetical protein
MTVLHGNLLEAKADVLVNPINTVGVMGARVAKAFKLKYPDMHDCRRISWNLRTSSFKAPHVHNSHCVNITLFSYTVHTALRG